MYKFLHYFTSNLCLGYNFLHFGLHITLPGAVFGAASEHHASSQHCTSIICS